MLSDDDVNLAELSDEELALAWDLWFDLAQATNDADPPFTHGVFARVTLPASDREERGRAGDRGSAADAAAASRSAGAPPGRGSSFRKPQGPAPGRRHR